MKIKMLTMCVFAVWLVAGTGEVSSQPVHLSERAQKAVKGLDSEDPADQRLALLQLEALREVGATPVVEPFLQSEDESVRAYAYRCLIALRGPEAIPVLLEGFETDGSERVQRTILFGLEPYVGVDAHIEALFFDSLTARDTEVRMAAVDVVSRLGTPEAKAALLYRADKEWRRDVKRVLTLALERLEVSD